MEAGALIAILSISLPLIGGGIGYLIRYSIDKRRELLSEVNRERRELYQKFIDLIIDILKGVKSNKDVSDIDAVTQLYEFYKKYILYASPEVINAFSEYFQYLYSQSNTSLSNAKVQMQKMCKVMYYMRKDLGLSNKGLGKDGIGLFRALFKDYDKLMS